MSKVDEVATKFENNYERLINSQGDPNTAAREVSRQLNDYAGTSSRAAKENLVDAYNTSVRNNVEDPNDRAVHHLSTATLERDGSILIRPFSLSNSLKETAGALRDLSSALGAIQTSLENPHEKKR